jgi:prevent-host-death family protein
MQAICPSEDIRSVTDLKRNTRDILDHLHASGRPVILTVNGRADSVLIDVKMYEKHLQAANLARLLTPAEEQLPERCASLPENELPGTGYRHLLVDNYRTIYSRAIIMRVLHGARLLDQSMLIHDATRPV